MQYWGDDASGCFRGVLFIVRRDIKCRYTLSSLVGSTEGEREKAKKTAHFGRIRKIVHCIWIVFGLPYSYKPNVSLKKVIWAKPCGLIARCLPLPGWYGRAHAYWPDRNLTNWRQFFMRLSCYWSSPRGSTATLTMLWRNSLSITGQTHKKADINLFFTTTNCRIARSRSLTRRMNFKFVSVRLLTLKISQWARVNFCSYRKIGARVTCDQASFLFRGGKERLIQLLDYPSVSGLFSDWSRNKRYLELSHQDFVLVLVL